MIYLEIFKKIFSSIFQKLGISGTAIILLIMFGGYEHHIIGNRDETISTLKTDIIAQNNSIDAAAKSYEELLGRIKDAQDKNAILDAQNQDMLRRLNSKPLALTCSDSMNEVKDNSLQNAQIWNAGRK